MRILLCAVALLLAGCSSAREPGSRFEPSSSQAAGGSRAADVVAVGSLPDLGTAGHAQSQEPGPEDGELRLRLAVAPRAGEGKEGYEVRLDLLNTSRRPVTLRAGWRHEGDAGDVKVYLEAATNIECVPNVAPWVGAVARGRRVSPQPEQGLGPGETLSVRWQTDGPHLKNRVTDPNEVQNPTFPLPGLYSVHATLDVITSEGTVRVRSNEQLVPVGGSRAMPRYTRGPLLQVDPGKKTAMLGLGSLHKVQVGNQFEIGHPKGMHWKLTITEVMPGTSVGTLELVTRSTYPPYSEPPSPLMLATLIAQK